MELRSIPHHGCTDHTKEDRMGEKHRRPNGDETSGNQAKEVARLNLSTRQHSVRDASQ